MKRSWKKIWEMFRMGIIYIWGR